MFSIIVATDLNNNIGRDGKLPWHNSNDLKFFKSKTKNGVVILGRKTYDSLKQPLKDRVNIVLTRNKDVIPGVICCNSLYEIIKLRQTQYLDKTWFVIGGAEIYNLFIENKLIDKMYITMIPDIHDGCDTQFKWDKIKTKLLETILIDINIKCYCVKVVNEAETAFLDLMRKILTEGAQRSSRNENTISLFANTLQFDLSNNTFPLLTTRKMFLRGIFEELMLFIRGQTDNEILLSKKISIWTKNTTREFLDNRDLHHLPIGDMGASYGFLFRHFGANYVNCKTDYTGQGIDQLSAVIKSIKNNPTDRRMIISLWDPVNLNNCPLPPCLYNYQFYVLNGKLSCMMTQRSSDYIVAGGWNIATGSLLTYLIATVCDLTPDRLIWNIGDTHIYNNLVDQAKEQIKREPYQFAKLFIRKKSNIEEFEYNDLELIGYQAHDAIKLVMNA